MNHQEARKIASEMSIWFFQNNLHLNSSAITLNKQSVSKPKYNDKMWAKLMTEAIVSFNEGLELDGRHARNGRELFDAAVDLVGNDAFQNIAFIVSAAGARRPIEDELEQSFDQMQQPGTGEGQSFTGVEGLSALISTDADANAYGMASTIIMTVESGQPTQNVYHQSAQQLQNIAKTNGISQPFAQALSSLGAEYMQMADELTRQSGDGQQQGSGTGISGLPTGVHIGMRYRAVRARRRIIAEALNG